MKARAWIAAAGVAAFAAALAGPAQADEKLLKDKGCTACHSNDKKLVGPAYKEVAKKYKGDAGASAKLAEKIVKGGSGVWGPVPMPPNKVSDDEAKKMVAFIMGM